jgi:hypothetical protein
MEMGETVVCVCVCVCSLSDVCAHGSSAEKDFQLRRSGRSRLEGGKGEKEKSFDTCGCR